MAEAEEDPRSRLIAFLNGCYDGARGLSKHGQSRSKKKQLVNFDPDYDRGVATVSAAIRSAMAAEASRLGVPLASVVGAEVPALAKPRRRRSTGPA